MINAPRFTYTNDASASVDLTLSIAARPWTPGSKGVGGIEFSAARVPSSFEIRRDRTLRMTLRFTEGEYDDVEAMLEHAQRGTAITVYPNGEDAANRECYLLAPSWQEGILPQPGELTGELTISVEWVSTGASWAGVEYFDG